MRSKGMTRLVLTALTVCVSTTLVLVGMSGGAPQAIGPGEFVVVDSTGKQVGILLDHPHHWATSGEKYTVVIPYQGDWFALDVERDHLQANSNILYYIVANCQGTAFHTKSDHSLFPEVVIGFPGDTLHVEAGGPTKVNFVSMKDPFGSCWPHAQSQVDAVPMTPAMNLGVFTPPFRAERTTALNFFQAKLPAPESDRFVGDGDPSLRQEVFDVPQARAGGNR